MKTFLNRNENELHFMVDIETLALTPNAAITEIGAIVMNPWHATNETFHRDVIDIRGDVNPSTIKWREENNLPWYTENDLDVPLQNSPHYLSYVLEYFSEWIKQVCNGRTPVMWCKGTDFDCIILRTAYEYCKIKPAWEYNRFHDMRTMQAVFPQFKVDKSKLKHNGLDDARMQAVALINIAEHIANFEEAAKNWDMFLTEEMNKKTIYERKSEEGNNG